MLRHITAPAAYFTDYTLLAAEAPMSTDDAAALLASCVPCELAREQGVGQFAPDAGDDSAEPTSDEAYRLNWNGAITFEGVMTGDGRLIESNALRWENLPIPFRWVREDQSMGHAGAVVVGVIETIDREASGRIAATGWYDISHEDGREAARQVGTGQASGVSVDLDDVSFEIRVAGELLESGIMTDPEAAAVDDDGRVTVVSINSDDEVMATTSARVRAATQCAIPAFEGARIALTDADWSERIEAAAAAAESGALVAAGATRRERSLFPVDPPQAWFLDPRFGEVTPLTIDDDGRVYGHLATWGTCHIGYPGQCLTPPQSPGAYAYFLTGNLRTMEGTDVRVGQITMDTSHPGEHFSAAAAMEHYSNTGRAMADIMVGQDQFGIWVAGAMRPNVSREQLRVLRASPLSGDWRTFRRGGPLELVGALAVNVQGFPVPRPQGLVASGQMVSLVAAGMIAPKQVLPPGTPGAFSTDDLRYLKRLIDRERTDENATRDEASAIVRRMQAHALASSLISA